MIVINNDNRSEPPPPGNDPGNTLVVIGDASAFFDTVQPSPPAPIEGFLLQKFESVTLPVSEETTVYAIQDSVVSGNNTGEADLRVIELS
jgi:hypothetical protein